MALIFFLVSDQTFKETQAMRTLAIVTRVLTDCNVFMHATRLRRLIDLSHAALTGHALALTQLALGSATRTTLRHRVKAVDRLLGSAHFASEHLDVYRTLAARWLSPTEHNDGHDGRDTPLLIVVDWSSLSADMQWHWLRASVVVAGRSLTLYEEVHPRKLLANYGVHQRFLERMACVLPALQCAPIILTDAGFRGTWFALVSRMGWRWVGRIRNREFVRAVEARAAEQPPRWFAAKALYVGARATCEDLGSFDSTRSRPNRCRLVRVKRLAQQRKRRYASGKAHCNSSSRKHAAGAREPWLLAASPSLAHLSAQAIVAIYAQRMKIEQSFRDTKNERLGLGLSRSMSHGKRRLEALLLIGHIATLAKRLIGEAAQSMQLQRALISRKQAKHHSRAEISVMTVASRLIADSNLMRQIGNPLTHIHRLRNQALSAINAPLRL
jgi:hypothetical protein